MFAKHPFYAEMITGTKAARANKIETIPTLMILLLSERVKKNETKQNKIISNDKFQ